MNSVDELNLLLGIGPVRPQLPVTLRKSGYLPVRALGKGSYGQALLVFHEPRQQYFVVKHLNLAGMTSRQRHDAHNEISILQKLHHPNIVQYVEYYEEHPHLYIVMEYADGGDVYSLLKGAQEARKAGARAYRGLGRTPVSAAVASDGNGLLSEVQVVSLFVQTTMAVKHMHDRRLLHRDIKSSNIFLTKNHVVKLGDFGISTVLQSTMAMASTMCGTPCYFSPELCQGRPYNNKSDMWALGVLLYELCAGYVPFESTAMKTLMRDIVHKQPARIPALYSDQLWDLIVQLLQKDPRRRPDAGQVLMSPALIKYIPELIDQLASDPAYAAAASNKDGKGSGSRSADDQRTSGGARAASSSAPENPSAAPAPPPRRSRERHTAAVADAASAVSPHPSPAVPSREKPSTASPQAVSPTSKDDATASNQRNRAAVPSSSPAPRDQHGVSPATPTSSKQPPKPGPPSSTASIASLLARFDAQKQQLADKKLKDKEQHHRKPHGESPSCRREGNADLPELREKIKHPNNLSPPQQKKEGRDAAALAHLSPGAAAALRQQGLDPEGASPSPVIGGRTGPHSNAEGGAGAGGCPRRGFVPPPLPAALRGSTALYAQTPESNRELAREASAVSNKADAQNNGKGKRAEGSTPSNPSPYSAAAAAAAAVAGPKGSEELGAVLSELSTWRERSLRHQRKQNKSDSTSTSQANSSRCAAADPNSASEAGPLRSAPPQRRSPESHEKARRSSEGAPVEHKGGATPNATSQAGPSGVVPDAVAVEPTPSSSKDASREAQRGKAHCPGTGLLPSLSAASSPKGQTPQRLSAQKDGAVDPLPGTPSKNITAGGGSPSSPLAASSRGSVHTASDDEDNVNSRAQSFVDAMGTTLDVRALQATSASSAAAGAAPALSGTAGRHSNQQSMHKSYCGTSERLDALRATLKASPAPANASAAEKREGGPLATPHLPEDAYKTLNATNATLPRRTESMPGDVAGEGGEAADLNFTITCLCGRATITGRCLSMIYGSFICACDVCVRFTGAAQGVEWLHLPEIEDLLGLLDLSTPSNGCDGRESAPLHALSASASPAPRQGSVGGGAAAAAALRAQANHSPSSPSSKRGAEPSANRSAGAISPVPSPQEVLRKAGIRFYSHQQPASLLEEGDSGHDKGDGLNRGGVMETCTLYTCATCGGMMGMAHDGVQGILLPKASLDEQSLQILSSCAQTVVLEDGEGEE
ncbi:putative protein kinase [Leptomonas seymouri]|uniref:non-specific serine/threonine protein kinase n=1 Tax=Leptomonas seymouri TaxID=5684 RepID=A0A0N0P3H0_LEPSE|nr:putative protein kinase [Leptomonas seymouri]|eukprot:KPI84119.1 putative protein kinase [Leptomonas seymouri]